MLRVNFLLAVIFIFLPGLVYAGLFFEDKDIDFFKDNQKKDTSTVNATFINQAVCESCLNSVENVTLKDRVLEINKGVQANLSAVENQGRGILYVVVDTECKYCRSAVGLAASFAKNHSDWDVQGVILTPLYDFKAAFLKNKDFFESGLKFITDIKGVWAKQFEVSKVPAFIIIKESRVYRVYGQPDLEELAAKLR